MIHKQKIVAVVVFFNPKQDYLENINYLSKYLDLIIIIDNSESENLFTKFVWQDKVKYIFNGKNFGIAAALNKGAEIAMAFEADYLLMLDQDTIINSTFLEVYGNFLDENIDNKIGELTPTIIYDSDFQENIESSPKEIEVAITSGTLLNLQVFKTIGQFKTNLFIDYVDFEYCLRLRKNGYKVIQIPSAQINQRLGDLESKKILFKTVYVSHHSPIRYYYRTRNRFYVAKKYFFTFPIFVIKDFAVFINEIFKIFMFEKEKWLKIKMIVFGLKDFLRNRFGKY